MGNCYYEQGDKLPPAGTVFFHAGNTPPPGYLECDGSTVSRGQYARLFAAIGTLYGVGDGSTTFMLPDLKTNGMFIRARTTALGTGAYQLDALPAALNGMVAMTPPAGNVTAGTGVFSQTVISSNQYAGLSTYTGGRLHSLKFDVASVYRTANEVRPVNVAMTAIIRY